MRKMKNKQALLLLVLCLASCTKHEQQNFSSLNETSIEETSLSSDSSLESQPSSESGHSSERSSSETSRSSQEASSSSLSSSSAASSLSASSQSYESSSLDSSDDKEYCNVSIYQYYPVANFGHKQGEIRFDLIIQVEQGTPLFSSVDEHRSVKERLSPDYWPQGDGYWYCMSFYTDAECTTYYLSGTPILSDIPLYYYCGG